MHCLIATAWAVGLILLSAVLVAGCSDGAEGDQAEPSQAVAEEPAAVESSGGDGDEVIVQPEQDAVAPPADGSDEMLLDEDDEAGEGSALAEAGVFAVTWRVGGRFDRTVLGDPDAP